MSKLFNSKTIDHWVMKEFDPRTSQKEIFEWCDTLPDSIKFILMEAPVGTGKSPMALTISKALASKSKGDSFILTPQRVLQKQYEDTFPSELLASVYGKKNYTCKSKMTDCESGSAISPKCNDCPAKRAFQSGVSSPNMVMNYTLAFLYFMLMDRDTLPKRSLMVFDECHNIESHLVEFSALTVNEKKCVDLGIDFKMHEVLPTAIAWLKNVYIEALKDRIDLLGQKVKELESSLEFGGKIDKADAKLIKEHIQLVREIDKVCGLVESTPQHITKNYVLVTDKINKSFKIKELYGKNVFKSVVEPRADRFVFMSGTILDKDEFCSDLGIDPSQAAFISVKSEFPKENRQVIYKPTMKMSYGWNAEEKTNQRKDMLDMINLLLDHHGEDNGIIHTGSFQVANWLVDQIEGKVPHKIIEHGPRSELDRDTAISTFLSDIDDGKPKLLVSPSITEGLDLKDDKGRFSIIAKVPFPFLGDAWIKRRKDMSSKWYARQAMIAILQGCGRVVRSETDWGFTYILDSNFGFLYKQMKNRVPVWWQDALDIQG